MGAAGAQRLRDVAALLAALGTLAMTARTPASEPADAGDPIDYRRLERSDFRASAPPPDLAHHGRDLEAASCLRIVWPADLTVELETPGRSGSAGVVRASVALPRFHAVFDRACSWWAPAPRDPDYALAHEQVHFAIAEHFARELSRERLSHGGVRDFGTTEEQAITALREQMRRLASEATVRAGRSHDAYDGAMRGDPSGAAHRTWFERWVATLDPTP